jgi:hypothetical protein
MEQRKTNKKKLVVALALLALIVVASVITTVVLVLAAGTQNVGSNIEVTYSVSDVNATVTGKYSKRNATVEGVRPTTQTWTAMTGTGVTDGSFTIATTDTTAPTMSPAAVQLSSDQDYVVFAYEFTNLAANTFDIDLVYKDTNTEDKNITFLVYSGTNAVEDFEAVYAGTASGWASFVAPNEEAKSEAGVTLLNNIVCNEASNSNPTVFVYVMVKVTNVANAARFDGAFNFNLTASTQDA